MNLFLKLLSRRYQAEEDGSGTSGAEGAAPASGSTEGSDVDWADMNDGVAPGSDDDEEAGSEPAAAPAKAPAKPEGKAAQTPPTNEDVDPAELNPDGTAKKPVDPPKESAEPKPKTPEEIAAEEAKFQEDYTKWEQAEVENLSKNVYAFDEDTANRLQTEPELVLPKLAAQLEIRATRRALEIFQRMLPQVVPQVVGKADNEKKAADLFYGANPDLIEYQEQVLEAGKMFRRLNPKATPEEAIEKIGKLVRDSLGLKTPEGKEVSPPAEKRPPPHKPAGAGSTGAKPAAKPQEDTSWSDLLDD